MPCCYFAARWWPTSLVLALLAGTTQAQTPTQRDLDHARTQQACKLPNELIRQRPASTTKSQRDQLAQAGQAAEKWATTYLKPEATTLATKEQYFRALVLAGRYYMWANQYGETLRLYKQALPLFPDCRHGGETSAVVSSFCSEMQNGIARISQAKGYQYPPAYADDYQLRIVMNQTGFDGRANKAYEQKMAAASSPAERQRIKAEEQIRLASVREAELAVERQVATQDSLERSQGILHNRELLRTTSPENDQL